MAPLMARKEFRFLTSAIGVATSLPSSSVITTLTLGSNRMCPFCITPPVTPKKTHKAWSSRAKVTASSALCRSGSDTISSSGVPARLRSSSDPSAFPPPGSSWPSLPVSSSKWARRIRMVRGPDSVSISIEPPTQRGRSYWLIWYPFGRSG